METKMTKPAGNKNMKRKNNNDMNKMNKVSRKPNTPKIIADRSDAVVYKMPEQMAKEYLANRKGDEAKMHPNDYLIEVVNSNFGIKGHCVEVIVF